MPRRTQNTILRLKNTITNLQKTLRERNRQRKKLWDETTTLKHRIRVSNEIREKLISEKDTLADRIKDLKQQISVLTQENNDLKRQIVASQSHFSPIATALPVVVVGAPAARAAALIVSVSLTEWNRLQEEISSLQAQNNELNKRYNQVRPTASATCLFPSHLNSYEMHSSF